MPTAHPQEFRYRTVALVSAGRPAPEVTLRLGTSGTCLRARCVRIVSITPGASSTSSGRSVQRWRTVPRPMPSGSMTRWRRGECVDSAPR